MSDIASYRYKLIWVSVLSLFISTACNKSKFSSNYSGKPNNETSDKIESGDAVIKETKDNLGNEPILRVKKNTTKFELTKAVSSSLTKNSVWLVNRNGQGEKIELDENYPSKKFNGAGSGGHRTFISEIGLLMGVNGGKIYLTHDDFKENDSAKLIYTAADAHGSSRTCVASFLIENKPFIGAIYYGSDKKKFVRFPIDLSKPDKVDISKAEIFDVSTGKWGYSCYMDQTRGVLWGRHSAEITGVDVATGKSVEINSAPNFGVKTSIRGTAIDLSSTSQSYAISGGEDGMLLTAKGIYTMAYDAKSKVVFVSLGGANMAVVDVACFKTSDPCPDDKSQVFSVGEAGVLGPLSSLNDGRILALNRGAKSSVFIIDLVDMKDISQGINIEKIKEMDGDTYMYTDFTGATLYAAPTETVYKLSEAKNFQKNTKINSPIVRWVSESSDNSWFGLKMSIRCYQSESEKPEYTPISDIKDAGLDTVVKVDACVDETYDVVEIKVESDGESNQFTKTKEIHFMGSQVE